MRKAIVLDLDGVILKTEPIFKEIYMQDLKGDAKWDYFCENLYFDIAAIDHDRE